MTQITPREHNKIRSTLCAVIVSFAGTFAWGAGFHIQINAGAGLSGNQAALDAFARAAAEWESRITNDVTVYIDADLASLGLGIIGGSSLNSYDNYNDINLDYDTVRNAMAARAGRPGDAILAYLPTSAQVSAVTPAGATLDTSTIGILRANQRVLGLLSAADTRADATIQFSSNFTFDYNRFDANGVAPGTMDFQTAAAHEIGHALGFMSDVDDFDNYPPPIITSDNLTTLDLFRFPTANKPTTLSEFTTFARELTPGADSTLTDLNVSYAMSTGKSLGDGAQASHWQDDFLILGPGIFLTQPTIGIMDPTLNFGVFETVSESDLRAMELIGYDVLQVPEPRIGLLLLVSAGFLLSPSGLRRRRA